MHGCARAPQLSRGVRRLEVVAMVGVRKLGVAGIILLGSAHIAICAEGAHEVSTPCPGIRTETYVPNCPCTSGTLAFQVLASEYARLSDVKVAARNNSKGTIYIDPNQAGIPVLFRWNEALHSWDEVETWRCGNAGSGTKRSVSPGAIIRLEASKSSAEVELTQGPSVITFEDTELPTAGRYRLGLRFSPEFWPALVDLLSGAKFTSCKLELSAPFTVNQ